MFGPYWSVTKYKDIMKVETNPAVYSSSLGITLLDQETQHRLAMFIAMDPPKHDEQRLPVVALIVAPGNLAHMAGTIRERAVRILDNLPRNETFDWVEHVSIELTDADAGNVVQLPDRAAAGPNLLVERRHHQFQGPERAGENRGRAVQRTEEDGRRDDGVVERAGERAARLRSDLDAVARRGDAEHGPDGVHGELRAVDRRRQRYDAQLDQRRAVGAASSIPDEYRKLRENPGLIPNMVPEIIRWQTPLSYMRRTVLEDFELNGKTLRAGDKLAMWYISGNRDAGHDRANPIKSSSSIVPGPRQHLSFGFGIHRCVGNRLAELQLTILWEEIMKRFPVIEVMEPPETAYSPASCTWDFRP